MKKIILILLLGINLIFTSCTSSIPSEDKSKQTDAIIKVSGENNKVTEDTISEETSTCAYHLENLDMHLCYLTSEECEGRLVGTEGNRLAGEYIKKTFEDMGLEPFFINSFYDEYPQTIYPFEQQNHQLTAIFKDGSEKNYTYGTDYLERNRIEKVDLNVKLTDNDKDSNLSEKAVVLTDLSQFGQFRDKVKAVFVKEDAFFGIPKVLATGTPIIQITDELFHVLKSNKIDTVVYKSIHHPVESTQNNIVGVIKGRNKDKAIIISAHFDHVGLYGDTLFAGAVDNASGVSVLLEVAKELKAKSIETPFESDIIFCAFNGEEESLVGSQDFLADITGTYKSLANINIDCVGKKDGGTLVIEGDPKVNTDLTKIIEPLIIPYEHPYEIGELGLRSDHETFISQNIPAVNLGQQDVFQDTTSIHTEQDDMDIIDYNYLHDMVHLISASITQADSQYFERSSDKVETSKSTSRPPHPDPFKDDAYDEAIEKITKIEKERKDELKYDEYLFYVVGEYYGTISGNKPLTDINELHQYYPDIIITESLGDYIFKDIFIMNDRNSSRLSIGYPFKGDIEKNNKVLKRTFNYDDYPNIRLNYKKEEQGFTIHIHRSKVINKDNLLECELERYDYTVESTDDNKTIYWLKIKDKNNIVGVIDDYKTDKYRFIITIKPNNNGAMVSNSETYIFPEEVIQEFYNLIDSKELLTQLNLIN